jgi:hypothetical protein
MTRTERSHWSRGVGTIPVIAAGGGLAILTLSLWTVERSHLRALEAERTQTTVALNQARLQIFDLTTRLNSLTEKQREAAPSAPANPTPRPAPATGRKGSAAREAVRDPRVDRLQGRLTETQKELATTREDLSKAREELDGKINSARDDLNGSIAKTHDEIVALQKRGEQNIYEFKLTKSKQMQRVGPVSLSLRGTSTKHFTYDLAMTVDDRVLNKKQVNLYEPVLITIGERPQPLQLVVNRVGKSEIEGYLSEPKYRKSELAGNSEPPAQAAQQQQLSTR